MAIVTIPFFNRESELLKIVRASKARKDRAQLFLDYYRDQQCADLLKLIQARWAEPSDFRLFFINLVRKVIDKKSMVFKVAPVRAFEGWDDDEGRALYEAMAADTVLKKANRLTKLLKTSMIQVAWDATADSPSLSVLPPSIIDVVCDDNPAVPTRAIVTHAAARAQDVTYSDWVPTTYRKVDAVGRPLPIPGNRGNVNPYGVLPFVPLFDREPDGDFFLAGGDDLIEAQRAVNVALANLWRAIEWQTHGQAYATGYSPDGERIDFGPHSMITFPDPATKFGFAVPEGNLEPVLQSIEFLVKQTAVANDLAANVFEIDPKAESAAAKNAENRDLLEARQDDVDLWRRYEMRLFEVVKRVTNTHRPGSIPEAAALSVDFGEIGESLSEKDKLENYQRRIDLGLWSPVDALMSDNPDLRDRQEALQILQARQQETAIFAPALPGPAFPAIEDTQQ